MLHHTHGSNIASLRVRRQAQWALYVKTYTLPLGTFISRLFESRHTQQQPTATTQAQVAASLPPNNNSKDEGGNNYNMFAMIEEKNRYLSIRTLEMEFTRHLCAEDVAFIRRCVWLESLTLDLSWVKDSGIPSLKTLFGGGGGSFDGSSLRHLSLSAVTDVYAHHQPTPQPLSPPLVDGSDNATAVMSSQEETKNDDEFWRYFPPFLRSFELAGMNVNPSVSFARDWTVPLRKPTVPMESFEPLARACPGLVEVSVIGCSALKSLDGLSLMPCLAAIACCPVSSVQISIHQNTLHVAANHNVMMSSSLKRKREIMLAQCPFITNLSFLHHSGGGGSFFHNLTSLSTIDCPLESLEALTCCPYLRTLEIYECSQLQTLKGLHSDPKTLRDYTSSLEVLSFHMQPHLTTLEHMIPPLPEDAPSAAAALSGRQGCHPPPPPLRRFSFPFLHTLALDHCDHIQSLDCLARCEMPALVRFSAPNVPIPTLQPLLMATNILNSLVGGPEAEEEESTTATGDRLGGEHRRLSMLKEINIIGNTMIRSTEPLARLYREAVALCTQHGVEIDDAY